MSNSRKNNRSNQPADNNSQNIDFLYKFKTSEQTDRKIFEGFYHVNAFDPELKNIVNSKQERLCTRTSFFAVPQRYPHQPEQTDDRPVLAKKIS